MTYSELELVAKTSKGHVSNVKLFDYFDQARMEWYRFCIDQGVEAVAVHISVDYKKEVFNNDSLIVRSWLERVGNTSFTLMQRMENTLGNQIASAEVVLTTINRQTRIKTAVPQAVRDLLHQDAELVKNR
ncbi:thioesterase family protein [Neobacillus niacini]|uniref:acyl-CoA thioesterase n=1 Tax=Neobacillus niacini TaxID=86668 RepID=UPI0021CB03FD|nr:acyl-CoA thioesterase [Neobacillus niacini]MCM3764378.1 acyl-CoA thioesterase [Neobacillus niacini]